MTVKSTSGQLIIINTAYTTNRLTRCTTVHAVLESPISEFDYITNIFDTTSKDFKDIKRYTITYSRDCKNTAGAAGSDTVEIAPDYVFGITKKSCTYQSTGAKNKYTVQIDGINGNLVSGIKFNTFGAALQTHAFTVQSSLANFVISTDKATASTVYSIEITTTAGFIYTGTITIVQDTTITCGWNGTFASPISFPLTTPGTNPPANVVQASAGQLKLNSLFALTQLVPGSYKVKVCEVDVNGNESCIEAEQYINCHVAPCTPSTSCDPTEDTCNVILEVKKQHDAMIYGLDCCNEAKRNLLTHYIRLYCSTEATCL